MITTPFKKLRRNIKAFTLVEILVFTAIVSVFFVVAAGVSAFSLNVMKSNENKVYASHYAEEMIEWLRNQKEINWTTFKGRSPTSKCFVTLLNWPSGSACHTTGRSAHPLDGVFNRDVVLSNPSVVSEAGNVNVQVTVSWLDIGGVQRSVITKTVFAQFE